MRDALHLVTRLALGELPAQARILCVGAGTGAELLSLAAAFPGWRFTAVDPSEPMLRRCRARAPRPRGSPTGAASTREPSTISPASPATTTGRRRCSSRSSWWIPRRGRRSSAGSPAACAPGRRSWWRIWPRRRWRAA
ncbi:class I SAM-dependent methyltransferase [Anaeromyxobacter sp. K]|uniref:class I SAM-dependent methyltransferase n=1 Tax=Anaeromyxobacter sp. (strain K) TaxID=447217 RepID=UPI001E2A75A1|nr:class I SAM-dependent methyltransferase [Anaeromyxobacter sp. K]